jgi:hypothetical protein
LKPDLSRAIQWLNLSFSGWYNRLHRRRGPLFQGRFKAVLHDPEESALIINRYVYLNPVRIKRLGGHEARAGAEQRLGPAAEEVDKGLVRARVEALNSYRWSSYPAYLGKVKKPDWLSTESIRQLFGSGPVQSFRSAYRRQLEEMAGFGKWEEGWKESIKASVLHGTEKFVAGMLKELQGDPREQTGRRQKERLSLEWSLLDRYVDRSMAKLGMCRLEWSWILIGTSGGGGEDFESVQASYNISYSKPTT